MNWLPWPPQFDGFKIDNQTILGRVKDTDIWIELTSNQLAQVKSLFSNEDSQLILAWIELFCH